MLPLSMIEVMHCWPRPRSFAPEMNIAKAENASKKNLLADAVY